MIYSTIELGSIKYNPVKCMNIDYNEYLKKIQNPNRRSITNLKYIRPSKQITSYKQVPSSHKNFHNTRVNNEVTTVSTY